MSRKQAMQATALLRHQQNPEAPDLRLRVGAFDVGLAASACEREAAQRVRQTAFGAGVPDADAFDALCDHLIVRDTRTGALAGTARLLRTRPAHLGFSSESEFALAPLIARHARLSFCEVGRACIAPAKRGGAAVNALWAGLAFYARLYGIDVYFGTASLPGADPARHARTLAFLANTAPAPADWRVRAHPHCAVPIPRLNVPPRPALRRHLPPLLRGYLALGAYVSPEAALDPGFGTTDMLVLMRLAHVPALYRAHFSHSASKGA